MVERLIRMKPSLLSVVGLIFFAIARPALGETIVEARYEPRRDQLFTRIAYRGTSAQHKFALQWEACAGTPDSERDVAVRMIDEQGDDIAARNFVVTRRFQLADLPCRPVRVTLRLGRTSHVSVFVMPL
jgi:hypothetical protein